MKPTPFKTLLLTTILLMASAAPAQVPQLQPLNYKGKYEVAFSGITIGRLMVEIREDNFSYKMIADTKTSGLAKLFSKEKSVAKAQGVRRNGGYFPVSYESRNDRGEDKITKTNITYDSEGDIKTYARDPLDSSKWRPVVPRDQANSGYDPMTGFLVARAKLRDAIARNQKEVTVRTYDGARLAEMKIEAVSPARIEKMGTYVKAVNIVVTRHPIDGYTQKEWKKFKEGDPPIHIYLSADEQIMPLQISVALPYGTLTAKLVELKD